MKKIFGMFAKFPKTTSPKTLTDNNSLINYLIKTSL